MPPIVTSAEIERPAAELTHIDPPRTWGVRGTDGPMRATVDVLVEPVADSR